MLQTQALCVRYGEKLALGPLTWEMAPGELWSFIGPNGAGKSSLIKALLGLVAPSSGQILVQGRPLDSWSRLERAKFFSYVPQASQLRLPFTVEELVAMGRYAHQRPFQPLSPLDRKAMAQAMELAGVQAWAQTPLAQLSGGERQLVLIAAALSQEAKILVLDEGLTYLDYPHQKLILTCLQRLHQEGLGILTVHHDLNHSFALGGKALALRDGQTRFVGEVAQLADPTLLQEIFQAPLVVQRHPHQPHSLAFLS